MIMGLADKVAAGGTEVSISVRSNAALLLYHTTRSIGSTLFKPDLIIISFSTQVPPESHAHIEGELTLAQPHVSEASKSITGSVSCNRAYYPLEIRTLQNFSTAFCFKWLLLCCLLFTSSFPRTKSGTGIWQRSLVAWHWVTAPGGESRRLSAPHHRGRSSLLLCDKTLHGYSLKNLIFVSMSPLRLPCTLKFS